MTDRMGNWGARIAVDKHSLPKVSLFDDDNTRGCLEVGVNGCTTFLNRYEAEQLKMALEEWLAEPPHTP